ncbi:MAG: type II toxin-antitoxin system YafQ family toxin [Oscillospiraceae bacterium]|nr:type II toxin-antitoxin system YafQ family toxin [Oscillospiraceae bacterium]
MKYEIKFTNQFKKDLKVAKKQGKDIEKLFEIIEKLANQEPLASKYHDHGLTGKYKGCRECHIDPDWLLIYEIIEDIMVLLLYRVGNHSELFK